MFADSILEPPTWNALFRVTWRYLPNWVLDFVQYIPTREYKRFRRTLKVINGVSKTLVENAITESRTLGASEGLDEKGRGKRDVMSVLGTSIHPYCPSHCSAIKH